MNAPDPLTHPLPTSSATQPDPSHVDLHGAVPMTWESGFQGLGEDYHTALAPQPLSAPPYWVAISPSAAALLGLPSGWDNADMLEVLAGNQPWPGSRPVATVYSGHQFGVWAGQLGDGRAHLIGQCRAPDGSPWEIQLKGSGLTPYSRMGDGRAVLRSSIREFLCSEAMAGLGIPTTRALAVVGADMPVRRETMETAAVVTRLSPSFIRFGHFEHFCHSAPDPDHARLRRLADHVIAHHYPDCADAATPYVALLQAVTDRTAHLIAQWQAVGFCHGVMNTDNLCILGLTIDYGPFGFLDGFDPGHICNHSDEAGRYAYNRQPTVALWNLHALAQAMLPLNGDSDAALAALQTYRDTFPQALLGAMRAKLGLSTQEPQDSALVERLLALMAADRADYTITFRRLCRLDSRGDEPAHALRDLFVQREAMDAWVADYRLRLRQEHSEDGERAARMLATNPKYILRNHLAQRAIDASLHGAHGDVQRLLTVLERPFDEHPAHEADAGFPPDWAASLSVSCSS